MPEIGLAPEGPLMLFLLALLEGPFIIASASALAHALEFRLGTIGLIAVAADLTGDVLLYSAGRFLWDVIPDRFHSKTPTVQLTRAFERSGGGILVVAKLTHVAGLPPLLAAGSARMPLMRFLWWSLVGTVPKVTLLVLAGWAFGTSAVLVLSSIGSDGWMLAAIAGLGITCAALWILVSRRKESK